MTLPNTTINIGSIRNQKVNFRIYLTNRCINLFNRTTSFRSLRIIKINLTTVNKNNTIHSVQLSLIKRIPKRSIRSKNIISTFLTLSLCISLRYLCSQSRISKSLRSNTTNRFITIPSRSISYGTSRSMSTLCLNR